ncbi:MAG: hypothetical protein HYV24_11930 [Deltaproteobacteria bacterium]|nr:hypothetical protein [Deltaproteobacteria bacterium]
MLRWFPGGPLSTIVVIIIVLAALALIFALKSRGVGGGAPAQPSVRAERPRSFTGSLSGVDFVADSYDSTTVTVEIDAKGIKRPLEVNARKGRPEALVDERKGEIEALLDLGADYIDIGFNTDRVAAEFPVKSVDVTRGLAERVVAILIRLRDKSF